jgi:peptidoglycan hydrolase-like protein with peptidoglycan-binding domain
MRFEDADREFYETWQALLEQAQNPQLYDPWITKYIDDRPFDRRSDNVKRAIRRIRLTGRDSG